MAANSGCLAPYRAQFRAHAVYVTLRQLGIQLFEHLLDIVDRGLYTIRKSASEAYEEFTSRFGAFAVEQSIMNVANGLYLAAARRHDSVLLQPDPNSDHVIGHCSRIHVYSAHDDDKAIRLNQRARPRLACE